MYCRFSVFLYSFILLTNLNAKISVGIAQVETSKPGKQPEDAYYVSSPDQSFVCGVFDGHSISAPTKKKFDGGAVSKLLAKEIQTRLAEKLEDKGPFNAARYAFEEINGIACKSKDLHYCGSTAIIGYLANGGETFYIANVGDSQALVVLKNGKLFLTTPHNPLIQDEKARIEKTGGVVTEKNIVIAGDERGIYKLGTSRSIGDPVFKKFGVICEPDLEQYPVNTIDYIIFGTDGFWDKFRDADGIRFLKHFLKKSKDANKTASDICQYLANTARFFGSIDDITVLGVFFD